ncbi:uncharacterized protein F54H12.2-like [Heteronotia binoei]|uniref:uncharacterized protein F54H12.2-like n=1 Tax=Heteronotia binoei TaxID=13085 RepID=UPI002931B644|nr:uncharacterized protein F54H12.2-like [Heteronotia binoei]
MAFIHSGSEECTKSELDLFQIAPTQTSIERCLYIEVPPLAALSESAPLDFFIAGNGDDYMDYMDNTLLYLCCKIVKEDWTDLDRNTRVNLMNYPIASIFNQLDVTLGDRLITQSHNTYSYRGFIEAVVNYSNDTLNTQFSSGLFYKYTAAQHESTALDGDNKGFVKRAALAAESRKIDLLGQLHSDLFFQEKLLVNGMDVKIKLTRSKDAFCLMADDLNRGCKLNILSASLFIKKVRVAPSVCLGHAEALFTANAKYPVDHVGIKVFSIPAGSHVNNQENLFWGQLPKLLVIGLVDNESFSGAHNKNPFNFKHYDINFFALYLDAEQVPTKPLQLDFEGGNCVREYMQLVQAAGKHMKDRSLLVNRKVFAQGYTLFAFDLSPDQECADHYSLIKTGNLRAEMRLTHTVNMIVYSVFDNVIEINHR